MCAPHAKTKGRKAPGYQSHLSTPYIEDLEPIEVLETQGVKSFNAGYAGIKESASDRCIDKCIHSIGLPDSEISYASANLMSRLRPACTAHPPLCTSYEAQSTKLCAVFLSITPLHYAPSNKSSKLNVFIAHLSPCT
eukprot:571530-Pelagomonas_calceolata.AAC.1